MTVNEKPQILVVDDSPIDIQIMLACLSDEFIVSVAKSGKKALEYCAGDNPPKVVLLDVTMPEMNGFETCELLKKANTSSYIDVIFVSANETLEEKLKGYDVGGSDYVTKPFQPEELRLKVRKAIARELERESAVMETKMAFDTAMTAIMDAGEQAAVVHFLRESFTCSSFDGLAKLVLDCSAQFELSNSIQIRTPWKTLEYSSSGNVSPIEVDLFNALQNSSRIQQYGRRLFLNFGSISQIIKNLPEDEEKVGRLRDHLAIILEGAVNRIRSLLISEELKSLMAEMNESLLRVKDQQSRQKKQGVKIMDDLREEIQTNFIHYGLTEEQEIILTSLIENYAERSFASYEDGLKIDAELKVIADRIKHSFDHTWQKSF